MQAYLECGGLTPLIPNLQTSCMFFQLEVFASLAPRKGSHCPLNMRLGVSQVRSDEYKRAKPFVCGDVNQTSSDSSRVSLLSTLSRTFKFIFSILLKKYGALETRFVSISMSTVIRDAVLITYLLTY
jgi:hypothetical protein